MSNCESRLTRLQRQFTQLLLTTGEKHIETRNSYQKEQLTHNRLIEEGFKPKVVRVVYAKILRSGRPMDHYSKATGLLKKRFQLG